MRNRCEPVTIAILLGLTVLLSIPVLAVRVANADQGSVFPSMIPHGI